MPRVLSAALEAGLAKTVTAVGYLVRWNMTVPMLWSNLGLITWNGMIFAAMDFNIEGIQQDADTDFQATIAVQNLDNVAAAVFLNEYLPDVTVDVWTFEKSALGNGDVVHMCRLVPGPMEIHLDKLSMALINQPAYSAWSPRRFVDPLYGFNYALPPNSQIPWEQEIYIVTEE